MAVCRQQHADRDSPPLARAKTRRSPLTQQLWVEEPCKTIAKCCKHTSKKNQNNPTSMDYVKVKRLVLRTSVARRLPNISSEEQQAYQRTLRYHQKQSSKWWGCSRMLNAGRTAKQPCVHVGKAFHGQAVCWLSALRYCYLSAARTGRWRIRKIPWTQLSSA